MNISKGVARVLRIFQTIQDLRNPLLLMVHVHAHRHWGHGVLGQRYNESEPLFLRRRDGDGRHPTSDVRHERDVGRRNSRCRNVARGGGFKLENLCQASRMRIASRRSRIYGLHFKFDDVLLTVWDICIWTYSNGRLQSDL